MIYLMTLTQLQNSSLKSVRYLWGNKHPPLGHKQNLGLKNTKINFFLGMYIHSSTQLLSSGDVNIAVSSDFNHLCYHNIHGLIEAGQFFTMFASYKTVGLRSANP